MPFYALLCTSMHFYALLCTSMHFYALLCPFMPFYALLCPSMPFYALLCPSMPFYALLCPSMPIYIYFPLRNQLPFILILLMYNLTSIFYASMGEMDLFDNKLPLYSVSNLESECFYGDNISRQTTNQG